MITIQVLGLDQYVIGHYSKDSTADIANILETTEDEINFYAPCDSLLFHNGVEQTSWNTVVFVKIPKKYEIFEAKLADYLLKTLKEFSINVEINFEYIAEAKSYEYVNESYPRFLTEKNIVNVNDMDDSDEDDETTDDADPRDRSDVDYNDPNQLYLGNAFEGKEKELDELNKKSK